MMNCSSASTSFPPRRCGFVGVHIGAGQHSESRTQLYLAICSAACKAAVQVLRTGGSAVEAAAHATTVLEDAGETNAGYGSNLTESGTVEMDAGLMDGSTLLFGAVGAMPDIKNPIQVAKLLVQEQTKGLLPLGRVPPLFMVGEGARDWAIRHGVNKVSQESLVSEKANKLYRHYKKKLESYNNFKVKSEKKTKSLDTPPEEPNKKSLRLEIDDHVTDTVGVVVLDCHGNVASTVSSGGIALKQPGRVGQASCFGCGCWAQNRTSPYGNAVGVSTTGCGEHLVRTFLAQKCAAVLGKAKHTPLVALRDVMKDQFAESEFLQDVSEKLGGCICLHYDNANGRGEFLWTHTTASMGIAFQSTEEDVATAKMSRLPQNVNSTANSTTILVEAVPFSTEKKETILLADDEEEVTIVERKSTERVQINVEA